MSKSSEVEVNKDELEPVPTPTMMDWSEELSKEFMKNEEHSESVLDTLSEDIVMVRADQTMSVASDPIAPVPMGEQLKDEGQDGPELEQVEGIRLLYSLDCSHQKNWICYGTTRQREWLLKTRICDKELEERFSRSTKWVEKKNEGER